MAKKDYHGYRYILYVIAEIILFPLTLLAIFLKRAKKLHRLRKINFLVNFPDEVDIPIKLPSLGIFCLFSNTQGKLIEQCAKFSVRPTHEVLLRKLIFDLYDKGIISKNMSIIDIGSWLADNTIVWSKMINSETSKIFAIDPSLDNINFGKKLAKLNNSENISWCQNVCSSQENEKLHFDGSINHAVFNRSGNGKSSPVTSTTIDTIIGDMKNSIGLFHIDVEGFEELVLKGSHKVITHSYPFIFFEQHISEENPYQIIEFLEQYSYRIFMINEVSPGTRLDCRNFLAAPRNADISEIVDTDVDSTKGTIYKAVVGLSLIPVASSMGA
ncbi:MAG: FkbM family methyltransferase [Gammaproteobacteria bacterium]|nr:FkbM family methyltransferase [Gammaproteobacteria bacterium]